MCLQALYHESKSVKAYYNSLAYSAETRDGKYDKYKTTNAAKTG